MKKILLLFIISAACLLGENLKPTKVKTPPIIDGNLEDWEWKDCLTVSSFKTFSPDFGKNASQLVTAYAAYDSDNLYFAFHCYDNEPDKIKNSVSRRDNILSDDWVCINLDSFNDQQSLYGFYINPSGIQADSRFASNQEDFSADFIWESAGKLVAGGYTIEIAIPLKSIRYADTNPVTMSIFFERYISRLSEHSSYPELKAEMGMAFLSQMKPLEYYDIRKSTLFEILPAFTYNQLKERDKNNLITKENKSELSFTTKYGITSDLVLDATYNPDFSQIESDAGQVDVNLRYSLFYPEKRPFFLEGNEIFNFAGTSTFETDTLGSIVHTRTIVNPLTGIKLSGKIGPKNILALLFSADELPNANNLSEGKYAYFPILRFKRVLSNENYIGGIYTSRETTNNFNRAGGVDGLIRLTQSSILDWNGIYSVSKLLPESETKSGSAISIHYFYNTRDIQFDAVIKNISENFALETGYLTRTGVTIIGASVKPRLYPSSSFISRIDLAITTLQTYDIPGNLWETNNVANIQALIFGSLNARFKMIYSTEIFEGQKFNTGGYSLLFGGWISNRLNIGLNFSSQQAIYYSSSPYQGKSNRLTASLTLRPTENIESVTSFVFANFFHSADDNLIYDYSIAREKLTYQLNKYLFLRGIVEYNKFKKQLLTDVLASFTYVPGTVMHVGYGSLFQMSEWDEIQNRYTEINNFREAKRGFYFKMSYLMRL